MLLRLKVAKRISKAEAKLRTMVGTGTTGPKLRIQFSGPPQPYPTLDLWCFAWLLSLWRGKPSVSVVTHENGIPNIELMMNLADIVQWQLYTHKQGKQLRNFPVDSPPLIPTHLHLSRAPGFSKTTSVRSPTTPHRMTKSFSTAPLRGLPFKMLAEAEPFPSEVTWTEDFGIRILFFDPTLKAFIDAAPVLEDCPDALDEMIGKLFYEQPRLPPACYAL
ncbi:hypothetical protein M407DRAFT_31985 [Tulasnella calospora MUT 4182]|uniref:Uncharacterized protein n=1 Tax=Tulasnella calospora MUT 4182 TaxID=1051891 RepID=A0A0C3Q4T7_9AGAM|nr:hypothetical protein M407DRAFT_31985 [Tulasnella calospora MUT 4182]